MKPSTVIRPDAAMVYAATLIALRETRGRQRRPLRASAKRLRARLTDWEASRAHALAGVAP